MANKNTKIVVCTLMLFATFLQVCTVHADNKCIFFKEKALQYSIEYINKCAEIELAFQNLLAYMYNSGTNLSKDHKKALHWYQRTALNNYPSAMFNLGNMYFDGKGIDVDYKKAFYWYEKAAKSGDIQGQHNLAYMYGKGMGVMKDLVLSYN